VIRLPFKLTKRLPQNLKYTSSSLDEGPELFRRKIPDFVFDLSSEFRWLRKVVSPSRLTFTKFEVKFRQAFWKIFGLQRFNCQATFAQGQTSLGSNFLKQTGAIRSDWEELRPLQTFWLIYEENFHFSAFAARIFQFGKIKKSERLQHLIVNLSLVGGLLSRIIMAASHLLSSRLSSPKKYVASTHNN
jgi:hypothetical protein